MFKKAIILSSALFMASCATILTPDSQKITFNSSPTNANVYVDGNKVGQTPITLDVEKDMSSSAILLSKKGYHQQRIKLKQTIEPLVFLNALFIPGAIIDVVTGHIIKYSKTEYNETLVEK